MDDDELLSCNSFHPIAAFIKISAHEIDFRVLILVFWVTMNFQYNKLLKLIICRHILNHMLGYTRVCVCIYMYYHPIKIS